MDIGISSSCFYPSLTEDAFKKVGELGAKSAEIFFNASEETGGPILNKLLKIQNYYGIDVRSIHPYTSFAEPFMIFGGYERRIRETVEFYKRYFEAACALNAQTVVLHGGYHILSDEEPAYFESFGRLCAAAKPYGVIPAHETVTGRIGSNIDFMLRLKSAAGENFKIVLDTKQCRRNGTDEYNFIRIFAKDIVQIHISDYDNHNDCIPPGEGKYDFLKLFKALKCNGYNKSAIIELYSSGFKKPEQILRAKIYLENIEQIC